MTTDELRAKFEAHCAKYARNLSLRRHPERDYWYEETRQAWELWQSAHASRDAEVEALRKDAERYRWLRDNSGRGLCVREKIIKDAPCDGNIHPARGDYLDVVIDAARQEESK